MRYLLPVLLLASAGLLFPQPPAEYYGAAEGLSGAALKSALYGTIKGHTEYPYNSVNTDVWDILKETDRDTGNPDNVLCLYTGFSYDASLEYDSGAGWTREHVWAVSHGDFGTTMGPGTDVHHIRPADNTTNSARSNRDFDNGGERYIDGGTDTTDNYRTPLTWEPRPEVKGDIARMLFYMAVRYEGEGGEPDLELTEAVPSSPAKEPLFGKLSTLLLWHRADPVDDWEMNRNDVIFGYQGNRNPFIDRPEFVEAVWGGGSSVHYISIPETEAGDSPFRKVFTEGGILLSNEKGWSDAKGGWMINPAGFRCLSGRAVIVWIPDDSPAL